MAESIASPENDLRATAVATDWTALRALALTGTRHQTVAVPAPAFAPRSSDNEADSRAHHALRAAAGLGLLLRAGYSPPVAPAPAIAPAAPEALPALNERGTNALRRMVVDSEFLDLLPGYLRDVAQAGQRVPHHLLVALLKHAAQSAETAATMAPSLGERGRWLAAHHPEWAALVEQIVPAQAADDLTTWETGTWAERRAWLTARLSADPAQGRALLLAALPNEPARQQEPLLDLLEHHLAPEAEPVLEALLKARGQDVRRRAAELLAQLPKSALGERLWARVEPLIQLKKGLLGIGKASLEITLPTAWDKSWLLDGIEEKSDHYRYRFNFSGQGAATTGVSAIRLGTMLALVPVRRWTAHFGLTPDELLTLALASKEWHQLLLTAWSMSAVNTRDTAFAEAFLRLFLTKPQQLMKVGRGIRWAELVALLSPDTRRELLLKPLLLHIRRQDDTWQETLGWLDTPWPTDVTEAVLAVATERFADTTGKATLPSDLSRLGWFVAQGFAMSLHPALAGRAAATLERIPNVHEQLYGRLAGAIKLLRFRQELYDSLAVA
jgi:Family of unknown function (DUF5691)